VDRSHNRDGRPTVRARTPSGLGWISSILWATCSCATWARGWAPAVQSEDQGSRQQRLDAPDQADRLALSRDLQNQALIDVPYVPIGQMLQGTAYRNNRKRRSNETRERWRSGEAVKSFPAEALYAASVIPVGVQFGWRGSTWSSPRWC